MLGLMSICWGNFHAISDDRLKSLKNCQRNWLNVFLSRVTSISKSFQTEVKLLKQHMVAFASSIILKSN